METNLSPQLPLAEPLQEVCCVREATVSLTPSRVPFSFVLAYSEPTSGRIELQAENEDDMVKWVTAIRRCKVRFQRRSSQEASSMRPLVASLLADNQRCCECDNHELAWASYNIGCVLCEYCAGVHRQQLGYATSKLRSLELDDWPIAMLECFTHCMGNAQVSPLPDRRWDQGLGLGVDLAA